MLPSIVLTLVAQSATPLPHVVGVLVGLAHQEIEADDRYSARAQSLESCFIELTAGEPPKSKCRRGLFVPRQGRVDRYVMRRTAQAIDKSSQEHWLDSFELWPLGQPEPSSSTWNPNGPRGTDPCRWSELRLLFASPTLLSFREITGNSEECEPRGWRGATRGWVQTHESRNRVAITDVAGAAASVAYQRAARDAHHRWRVLWNPDDPHSCLPDVNDEESWVIVRDRTRWAPLMEQQPDFSSYCHMSALIEWLLPESAIGFLEHDIPWDDVVMRHPAATSAHVSPDSQAVVVQTRSTIVVKAWRSDEEARLPHGEIVLVHWVSGDQISRWREVLGSKK